MTESTSRIQCHYDLLGIARDADVGTIKKAHRKLAIKFHPDKNSSESAVETFRLVQEAYEVLSDPKERQWYDDHRDAILAGWSASSQSDAASSILFDVAPYMHPGCYSGYDSSSERGFYRVYNKVFQEIFQTEQRSDSADIHLPTEFGGDAADWNAVQAFYQSWESFISQLNFAWEDKYDLMEAPNRRIRRLMEEDNKKARRNAKKTYNQDILTLVAFVKRRDPRVKAQQEQLENQKRERQRQQELEAKERKIEKQKAKEEWKQQAQQHLEDLEEADRMAGRVRLADEEDDYDYGGGKKKKKRGKKKKNRLMLEEEAIDDDVEQGEMAQGDENDEHDDQEENPSNEEEAASEEGNHFSVDILNNDEESELVDPLEQEVDVGASESESESEDEVPDIWRCECCRKDFKSEGQFKNHKKSKKHKEIYKKYQKKQEEAILAEMLAEADLE